MADGTGSDRRAPSSPASPQSKQGSGSTPEAPPHAPKVGLMRRLLGRFHVTGVFWYRFHRWGITILPEWGIWLFVSLFTTFFFVFLFNIRAAIAKNLDVVLGPCGFFRRQVRIYKTMWAFAWCLTERYEQLSTRRRVGFTIDGEETWNGLLDNPDGFVLVTAHVGNWEIGSVVASKRQESRVVHVIREEEVDPDAQQFIRSLIQQQGEERYEVHFARADDPGLGALLLAALRRGELVALQGDRPRASGRTVEVRLFERPFALPAGPAALARAAKVPMVPVFILRDSRQRSSVHIRKPIVVERSKDRNRDLRVALQQLADEIEWAIRTKPHQWYCFRDVWPSKDRS